MFSVMTIRGSSGYRDSATTSVRMLSFYFVLAFVISVLNFSLSAEEPGNCSTFLLKSDSILLVGHNLDESPELHIPGLVCINRRNEYREGITWLELIADPQDYEKFIVPFEEKQSPKISWISRYGSVTFNSEGLDFPDGGINEKGLAIFEMSLGNTRYRFDESNPTLFMPLWIQYQLDNCATLDEVIRNANEINLQDWSWHYFITDRDGNCAIIEFLEGEVVVHRDENVPYPILCNSQYSRELERLKGYQGFGGKNKTRRSFKKTPRFVRAAEMLKDYDASVHLSPKDYALKLLDEIKIKGWNKWGILVDVENMIVYFYTNRNRNLRYLSINDFDYSDGNPPKLLDIHEDLSGDVTSDFVDYTYEMNLEHARERAEYLFVKRFKGLIDNGVTAEVYAKRFADYSERMRNKITDPK